MLVVVVLLLAAGAGATMASKRQRTAERPAACPFAAFTESVGSMRDWLARHGDLDTRLRQGAGIATIPDFLPPEAAEAALLQLQQIPEAEWRCEQGDAEGAEGSSDEPTHRFSVCEQDAADVVGGLARVLWVARPQCLPSFSTLRLSSSDHLGRRDDRAQAEVMGADGEPTVFSRSIGAVLCLSKDWQPAFGAQFVDFAAAREQPHHITLAFNTLLVFEIPRVYAVSRLGADAPPLFAVHGWWMTEGELYSMSDTDTDEDEDEDGQMRSGPAAGTRSAVAAAIATKVRDHQSELVSASVPRPLPSSVLQANCGIDGSSALRTITAAHCASFQRDGLVVIDNVLPLTWARSVQDKVGVLERSGAMKATVQQGYGVRQDKIVFLVRKLLRMAILLRAHALKQAAFVAWQTAATAPAPIALAMTYLVSVAHALNRHLGLELLAPEAAMVTCFDGNGSHFVAHRDNACEVDLSDGDSSADDDTAPAASASASAAAALDGASCINAREVTAILYANADWDESHGGCLRCHIGADIDDGTGETAEEVRDVAPCAGRLVLFKSRELLHEVLPSQARRVAISLWLLDGRLPLRGGDGDVL